MYVLPLFDVKLQKGSLNKLKIDAFPLADLLTLFSIHDMARLSQLPDELLVAIWQHILGPDDIENFASVSKRIRATGSQSLQEHIMITISYARLVIPYGYKALSCLLFELVQNPRISFYVRKLKIHLSWHIHKSHDCRCYSEHDLSLSRQALIKSDLVQSDEIASYLSDIEDRNDDIFAAFILMHLKSFQTLELYIDDPVRHQCPIYSTIERMMTLPSALALSRLTNVVLRFTPVYVEFGEVIKWLKVFSALPSLRSIQICDCDNSLGQNEYTLVSSEWPRCTDIKDLYLKNCRITCNFLRVCLANTTALQRLRYHVERSFMGDCSGPFLPSHCQVLKDLLPSSIERISLRHQLLQPGRQTRAIHELILHLAEFKKNKYPVLRELEVIINPSSNYPQWDDELDEHMKDECSKAGITLEIILAFLL